MRAKQPAWDDLEIFLATAREGTLLAAASVLEVNASTVQRRIGKLEKDLSTRLFERSQRGYSLTSAGEDLFESVLRIEEQVLALGRHVGGRDQSLAGLIRVATVDDLAIEVLSPIFKRFRKLHPGVCLDISVRSELADLQRSQADVAIRFGTKPEAGDLVPRRIAWTEVGFYGHKSYFRKHGRPETLADLAEHFIVCGDSHMAKIPMEQVILRHGDPSRIALRSGSMLLRKQAIRDGLGIGFLACFIAESDRSLERIDLLNPRLGADLWMLVHVDLRKNARVRAFVDFVYEALIAEDSRFCAADQEN